MRHFVARFWSYMGGIACLLAFCAAQGQAALVTYNGFASTAGLSLVGNAATAVSSDGTVLRLTTAAGSQSGAAYSTAAITLGTNSTFSTVFQFRFTNPGGIDPADGITFVLAANPTGLGAGGGGLGYVGVPNSIAIEFDTYNNGPSDGNSSNHVAIDTGGNLTDTALTNVYGNPSCGFANGSPPQNPNTAAGCLSNGDLWRANISYNGSNLTVMLQDPAESSSFTAINSFPINLAPILGTNTAFVGFTSGTGAGLENHDIVNWQFADTTQLAGMPEPASLLLLGAGLLGMAGLARWRAYYTDTNRHSHDTFASACRSFRARFVRPKRTESRSA